MDSIVRKGECMCTLHSCSLSCFCWPFMLRWSCSSPVSSVPGGRGRGEGGGGGEGELGST